MNRNEADHPVARSEPISCRSVLLLAPEEAHAPTESLSPTKRAALIACVKGDGTLHKYRGVWRSPFASNAHRPIFGVTVADLSRDGMMTVTVSGKNAVARLTVRGSWFARTAATEVAEQDGHR